MNQGYQEWLEGQGYKENTVTAQLHRSGRVEKYYGDLDHHFQNDGLSSVIEAFVYTAKDAQQNRKNPTLIPYKGAVRGNMNGYKFAVCLYKKYCEEMAASELDSAEIAQPFKSLMRAQKRGMIRSSKSAMMPMENPTTLMHFGLDGFAALRALITASHYGTLAQAMASLTLFTHPDTVRQTGGRSIFRTIRGPRTPGVFTEKNGKPVMLDDNKSASDAFKWANGMTRSPRDVQFNHVYAASDDVEAYTSLANICVTPAFIAKLTDKPTSETSALLKYRVFDLYEWTPSGAEVPKKPEGYDQLDWAPTLPPVADLKAVLEACMARKPKDRTVKSLQKVGWLFGG